MPHTQSEQDPLVPGVPPANDATVVSHPIPPGTAVHYVAIDPATHFDFRYQSSEGTERVIYLQLTSLTAHSEELHEVEQFHASVDPPEKPTLCTVYTLPASSAMSARAIVVIEGGVPGDSIICHSHGSSAGLRVNVSIVRGGEVILREQIQDTYEYRFPIP